jgi:ABC-2 type transport system ATP-binding protein
LHVRLADPAQKDHARNLIERLLGGGILPATAEPAELSARLDNPAKAAEILAALTASQIQVEQFAVGNPSLDEVFLALTGRPAAESAPDNGNPSAEAKP